MNTRPLMLALAISATLLAGCEQQAASSPAAGDAAKLRSLGSLQFKPCSLASPFTHWSRSSRSRSRGDRSTYGSGLGPS